MLEGQDSEWSPLSDKNEVTFTNIAPGTYRFKIKALNNYGIESHILVLPITIKSPFWQTWWFRTSMILLTLLIIVFVVRFRERQYKSRQVKLEELVSERTKEAVSASERAESQRQLVEQKNKEILDSIAYAKRIQTAMLPTVDYLREQLKEIAVFYQPKDIVAGDFYWYEELDDFQMLAVADCTGHGVPGAMVSVICYNALNRSVREYGLTDPGQILDKTREIILLELSKHDENVKDGMDISLLVLNMRSGKHAWAGANTPLWMVRNGDSEISEIKADKQPIGLHINSSRFTTHQLDLVKGDTLFLFTDGYADQFGGSTGKKFKSANLKRLFATNAHVDIRLLEKEIVATFNEWKENEEQVDDVCVIAIRI
jgi:serine phosphatase RsbU (regulator of sigma subunit)